MKPITKCIYEGCDGDVVRSGGVMRSGIKVQRYQCRKCNRTFVSNEPYTPDKPRTKNVEIKKEQQEEFGSSKRKGQLPAPKCKKCGEFMNRTYVYQKKKNSKSGLWIPIGWSCAPCQKMEFTTTADKDNNPEDLTNIQKEISPRDERFCADIIVTGSGPIPQESLNRLKRLEDRTPAIDRICDAQYEVVGHAPITEEKKERLKRDYNMK
jgi:transposase-like protein